MIQPFIRTLFINLILLCMLSGFPTGALADVAKDQYLKADSCYKKLRHSDSIKTKEAEWLSCISLYENIARLYPDSSWSPAGMYQAAQLYIKLSELSGRKTFEKQAADLLARLRNKYPDSAYSGKAKTLLKTLDTTAAASRPNAKVSKKQLTRKEILPTPNEPVQKLEDNQPEPEKTVETTEEKQVAGETRTSQAPLDETATVPESEPPLLPSPLPSGDGVVTDLRFWSNPEYTRIVVNVDHDRPYTHRLLNKDPDINMPFQRLYVDVEQTKLGKNVPDHTPINDNLLKQARAGQFLPHTVRVVVDIKSFENYKIFSLKDPFRIVIDVWGKGGNGDTPASTPPSQTVESVQIPSRERDARVTTDNLQSSDIARQLALGVRKIVIDPGHGGSDPGAPGYYKDQWEKDIVLKISHKLAQVLKERLNCTVLLTRSDDRKLTLEERTAIANTKRADLFISLHCNAAKNKNLRGIETYFLNLATDSQAIAVAARENATSEKNISDLDYILSDLMKHAKIEESTRLANIVHKSFVTAMKSKYSDINDLGVKQAPFYVLLGARMPSILIETSFISNPVEGKRLMDDSYQKAIALAIADGITKYIDTTNPKLL